MKTDPRLPPLLAILLVVGVGAGCRGPEPAAETTVATTEAVAAQAFPVPEGLGYSTGLDDAPVTVVEFSDFGCPYCAQFALDTYPGLHTEFVLSGRVKWIFIPFVIGRFPNGEGAALAGECAGEQGRFWPMHDLLFEHQARWRRQGPADDVFMELAESAGVEMEPFAACYAENRYAERIARHGDLARQAQVRGTPSFRVNGQPIEGALPPDHFRTLLDWAVQAAAAQPPS